MGWIVGIAAAVLVVWGIVAIWGGDDGVETAAVVAPYTPETTVGAAGERNDSAVAVGSDELESGAGQNQLETTAGVAPGVPEGALVIDEDTNIEDNPDAFIGKTVPIVKAVQKMSSKKVSISPAAAAGPHQEAVATNLVHFKAN